MKLIHIKLKNGSDLLGQDLGTGDSCNIILNPVEVKLHPNEGFYAQSYLLFSEENSMTLEDADILIKSDANKRAKDIYESFFEDVKERQFIDDLDNVSDEEAEETLMALIDAKEAVKH